jgi:hypothetical protein
VNCKKKQSGVSTFVNARAAAVVNTCCILQRRSRDKADRRVEEPAASVQAQISADAEPLALISMLKGKKRMNTGRGRIYLKRGRGEREK